MLVSFFLYVGTAAAIMRILRHSQGLYVDRWAAPRLRWMLPEGAGAVEVRGSVPAEAALAGQAIAVYAAGRELGRWPVGPGKFTLQFDRPEPCSGPFEFELHASRCKRPRIGSEMSVRRMAWVVEDIIWASEPVT
jgi:hypothetical protein